MSTKKRYKPQTAASLSGKSIFPKRSDSDGAGGSARRTSLANYRIGTYDTYERTNMNNV